MEDVEVKQEPDDFYDSRLEPDVVIDDSVICFFNYFRLLLLLF